MRKATQDNAVTFDSILNPAFLHHAYLIEGDKDFAARELCEFCENVLHHPTQANPDFLYKEFASFGIDESRLVKELQSTKSMREGGKRIFVFSAPSFTGEAQNALLKVLEEPTPNTHFFIIMPDIGTLLPTLLSRVEVVRMQHQKDDEGRAAAFLKADYGERMRSLAALLEEKDKTRALSFVDELEKELYRVYRSGEAEAFAVRVFNEIHACRNYLQDRAPSVKMILEYIAVITPRA